MEHPVFTQEAVLPKPAKKRWDYTTIPVDEPSPVIPFCWDVTGKHMKMGCIENRSSHNCVLFIEGTEMRYYLHKNDRLLCVLAEDDTFVRAVARVQVRDGKFVFLDGDNMHLLYDGSFRFYRNGMLEFTLENNEKFSFRLSDQGNPFVFASHGVAIDAEGNLKAPDDTDYRYNKWSSHYYIDPYPEQKQYIFAMHKGRAGITLDRKAVYEGEYITGIPDPVVDIAPSWAGLWALTAKGQLYLADVDKCLEAALIAEHATAISSGVYEQYFVFADREGHFHVYNCREFNLKSDGNRTYLGPVYGKEKEYVPKILKPGRGRVSELCVHEEKVAFLSLHGGGGVIRLSDGRFVTNNW